MAIIPKIVVVCFFVSCNTLLASSAPSYASPEFLTLIGSTANKNFYATNDSIESLTGDYATALHHICKNNFQMELVAVESEEELAVIKNWFSSQFVNSTSSKMYWTSAVRFGRLPMTWATSGTNFSLPNAAFSYPWPSGAGASPMYSWYQCLSIYKYCNSPPGSPSGCWPIYTSFYYADCRRVLGAICQERIHQEV